MRFVQFPVPSGERTSVLSSFLVFTTLNTTQNAAFENQVERAVRDGGGTVLSYTVSYDTDLFSQTPTGVTVTVTDNSSTTATGLQRELREETGRDVSVTVLSEEAVVAPSNESSERPPRELVGGYVHSSAVEATPG